MIRLTLYALVNNPTTIFLSKGIAMSASSTPFVKPRILYAPDAHFEAAFAKAQAAGYITLPLHSNELLVQRWSAWCGAHQMPIIQICERRDIAWVSIDVVFCRTLLAKDKLMELRDIWHKYTPQPHALHGLSPVYCHFAGLKVRCAHAFAREIVILLRTAA